MRFMAAESTMVGSPGIVMVTTHCVGIDMSIRMLPRFKITFAQDFLID